MAAYLYELAWNSDQAADGVLLPGLIDPDQPSVERSYDLGSVGAGGRSVGG